MSDFEISMHLQADASALDGIADAMVDLATRLGAEPDLLLMWRADLHWNVDGSGPAIMGPPMQIPAIASASEPIRVRPFVAAYTTAVKSVLPWFHAGFVIAEGEQIESTDADQHWRYRLGAGSVVWMLAWALHEKFPEAPVFFGAAPVVIMSWEAYIGANGDLWRWDFAIIPPQLSNRFEPVADGFEHLQVGDTVVLARADAWRVLPWAE